MHYFKRLTLIQTSALLALASSLLPDSANAQVRYQLVVPEVLGQPVKTTADRGNEINENGETLLNRIASFAVWKDGSLTHMAAASSDYPASFSKVNAASINRFQQVVGSKTYLVRGEGGTYFDTFPFYWDPSNGLVDLDDLGPRSPAGAGSTRLLALNDKGTAIGASHRFDGESPNGVSAFTWSFEAGRAEIPALSSIESYSVTEPHSLNESGAVVGIYRAFGASRETYHERGFYFEPATGSVDLATLDPDFFQASHTTARAINESQAIVGEKDRQAFIYEKQRAQGHPISDPSQAERATRAYALNDRNVVAGAIENPSQNGPVGLSPLLWTAETGSIDLLDHIEHALAELLPEGLRPEEIQIRPKAINNNAQISARLDSSASFSREIILQPALDFRWHSKQVVVRDGTRGVLYLHEKNRSAPETIPASALGLEIAFECSSDMQNWSPVDPASDGIHHEEDQFTIELFVPLTHNCVFVKPTLRPAAR